MANEVFEIEGFEELNKQLKKLDDNVKRNEILKIQRRLAKPIVQVYKSKLPVGRKTHSRYTKGGGKTTYSPGNLAASVRARTVSKRGAGGNPSVQVLPDKTGSGDGYYRFMVVKKGFTGKGRGSRKGANTVVKEARDATLAATEGLVTKEAQVQVAQYIQKQINRLSDK